MEYVALLRAINVGKRRIKMDALVALFEPLSVTNARTHIASGNVLFESDVEPDIITSEIEAALLAGLDYEVATFLRTKKQLENVLRKNPFHSPDNGSVHIVFHAEKINTAIRNDLKKFDSDTDSFAHIQNEMFWQCDGPSHKSKFSNAKLERATGQPSTMRNVKTVTALIEKFQT